MDEQQQDDSFQMGPLGHGSYLRPIFQAARAKLNGVINWGKKIQCILDADSIYANCLHSKMKKNLYKLPSWPYFEPNLVFSIQDPTTIPSGPDGTTNHRIFSIKNEPRAD